MRALTFALLLCACSDSKDDAPPPREVRFMTMVDASGLSPDVDFEIPDGTRSISIIVEGPPDALLALGSFAMGDGVDRVQLPAGAPGPAMQTSYDQEQIGQMPGMLFQSIRLGTYTHVYPYRPDQAVIAGSGTLRIASNKPAMVEVTIVMPEASAPRTLPLEIYLVSDTLADPVVPQMTGELDRIFAQAGITVTIERTERLTGTAFESITDFNEPQESPTSQSAMLAALLADIPANGLRVFVVEGLPSGVAGLSLGTPGPPLPGSYYFGVLVRGGFPAIEMARVTAHEIAHFVALQHVVNRGISGMTYPDPLDDTQPGADNLMSSGTVLTPGQSFALQQSVLLR